MVEVELVYVALDKTKVQLQLRLQPGATVADALNDSGIYQSRPETQQLSVGIFAKPVALTTVLKQGDRIEIYRQLKQDPKEKRRTRAAKP